MAPMTKQQKAAMSRKKREIFCEICKAKIEVGVGICAALSVGPVSFALCGPCALVELLRAGVQKPASIAPYCAWCDGGSIHGKILHGNFVCPGKEAL